MATMLPDLLPAAETLAKGVKHIACYVADAIAERRRAFDEDESGDYLRCAGADALAESLGRMESDGPDATRPIAHFPDLDLPFNWKPVVVTATGDPLRCIEHNVDLTKCAQMPHAEGDEWNDEPSVCYFCDRPTDRTVVCTADFDTEYVCEKCAHIAQSPAAHGVAADGPAEACDILQSPSAGHPTCKHCADPVELVIEAHPQYGRAGVWLHVGGDGLCRPTYASPK
jgi:hypothetical protein